MLAQQSPRKESVPVTTSALYCTGRVCLVGVAPSPQSCFPLSAAVSGPSEQRRWEFRSQSVTEGHGLIHPPWVHNDTWNKSLVLNKSLKALSSTPFLTKTGVQTSPLLKQRPLLGAAIQASSDKATELPLASFLEMHTLFCLLDSTIPKSFSLIKLGKPGLHVQKNFAVQSKGKS